MKSLTESQRALELERKLFSSERMFRQVTDTAGQDGIDRDKIVITVLGNNFTSLQNCVSGSE